MTSHFADRLLAAMEDKGAPVCVGIDPVLERLPDEILSACHVQAPPVSRRSLRAADCAQAFRLFGESVIEAVHALVPAVKINIAFFEPFHAEGLKAYHDLVRFARDRGLLVIGDVKRADIGHTSKAYAVAQLGDPAEPLSDAPVTPDAITINPYFGSDGVAPFIEVAGLRGGGVFVLVQTSNPSAGQIQDLVDAEGQLVSLHVAGLVHGWSTQPEMLGESGYSCVGAVVSPRDVPSTRRLREAMPHCLFLVPGFGAQGRTADEVSTCFDADGRGAIINASRSVIYAHQDDSYQTHRAGGFHACVRAACEDFVAAVRRVLP